MAARVLSNRVDWEYLATGDHIYSWRAAYLYAHHGTPPQSMDRIDFSCRCRRSDSDGIPSDPPPPGIYVGDGMVIHFTRAVGHEIGTGTFLDSFLFSSSSPAAATTYQRCGHLAHGCEGGVMSCLDCFLHGGGSSGSLYLFHYAVSPAFFLAKARGGTCTLAVSDPGHVVVHHARYLLDKGEFGTYSLFKNNCEDFTIYCKTGLLVETAFSVGRSGQLASLTAAFSTVASSPLRFLTTSSCGLALVTTGMYCVG
jgi:hypothetical protein